MRQVGKLGQVMKYSVFADGATIMTEGAPAETFYLVEKGEAVATTSAGGAPKRFGYKSCFGEGILLAAEGEALVCPYTVTASASAEEEDDEDEDEDEDDEEAKSKNKSKGAKPEMGCYAISKADFESRLGRFPKLQAEQFAADPRKLLSDFFKAGDTTGPRGMHTSSGGVPDPSKPVTQWFAVYRPCSRDSIAKMLGTVAVGKGLNIKGKSAKKNRLSGFVPFSQISDNAHKKYVEVSPRDARTHIYYRNVIARQQAESALIEVMRAARDLQIEDPQACDLPPSSTISPLHDILFCHHLHLHDLPRPCMTSHVLALPPTPPLLPPAQINYIPDYEPHSFGLDIPEAVVREAYLMQSDLTPIIGWETGRASEPAFMDMNLHSVRLGASGGTSPNVVLYQFDLSDPMNPHGASPA